MDIKQFKIELLKAIRPLSYVTNVEIKRRTEISFQGLIG